MIQRRPSGNMNMPHIYTSICSDRNIRKTQIDGSLMTRCRNLAQNYQKAQMNMKKKEATREKY